MTQEELVQENEKLNARLQKAIQVFTEQKANITRLTADRDSANDQIEKLKITINDLEQKIAKTDAEDNKFFEQLQEIESLKLELVNKNIEIGRLNEEKDAQSTQLKSLTEDLDSVQANFTVTKESLDEVNQKYAKLVRFLTETVTSMTEYLA